MIEARKSRLFNAWFAGHATRRLQGFFGGVYASGLAPVARAAAERPLLLISNHTSWWDGMVALYLCNRVLRVDAYAMMDEVNLRRLPFFRKVGAFGVDLETPGAARESLAYSARLLSGPGKLVWIFPQGRERPITERPLGFRRGSAVVAQAVPDALVTTLSLRYELGGREQPDLYLAFGEPRAPAGEVQAELTLQERGVTEGLDRIDAHLRGAPVGEPFDPIYQRRASLLARLAESWLAWATGRRRLQRSRPRGLPPAKDGGRPSGARPPE